MGGEELLHEWYDRSIRLELDVDCAERKRREGLREHLEEELRSLPPLTAPTAGPSRDVQQPRQRDGVDALGDRLLRKFRVAVE